MQIMQHSLQAYLSEVESFQHSVLNNLNSFYEKLISLNYVLKRKTIEQIIYCKSKGEKK